jgi:hypothetical protein
MTLREALSQIPDPRARNRQYPLWGFLALILVAFLSRVDSLWTYAVLKIPDKMGLR